MSTTEVPIPIENPSRSAAKRVASIDALRGITILLMIFVNDLGRAAPSWMHHIQPPDADGMTLADVVFPFFLFIAGVSIPLAFSAAVRRGEPNWRIFLHILIRTLALLTMGLIEVNRHAEITLGPDLWGLLAFTSIILAWSVVPKEPGSRRNLILVLKVIGILGIVTLFAVYRREPVATEVLFQGPVSQWTWLRTEWWGILGLIGWAYLVAAVIYFLFFMLSRNSGDGNGSTQTLVRREWLVAATALLMLLFLVSRNGGFFTRLDDKSWLGGARVVFDSLAQVFEFMGRYVDLGTQLGSLPSIMMSGCVLGTILVSNSDVKENKSRIRWALAYSFLLFLAALMTDTFAGINKISATPAWCFLSASLAMLLWIVLFVVMDILHLRTWAALIRPAGANPLIAYLLHPIILFALSLTGLGVTVRGYSESESAYVAVAGSIVMSLSICLLTGLIAKAGIRLRV